MHISFGSDPTRALTSILNALAKLSTQVEALKMDLTKLQSAVAEQTTVEQSAITLLQQLADAIKAANATGDQAAVDALADQIKTSADSLAASVTANTPSA